MNPDILALWNFSDPAESERRFESALVEATGEDRLFLKIQIARTYGLRQEFSRARAALGAIEGEAALGSASVRAAFHLELGRAWVSAAHAPTEITAEARATAAQAYQSAFEAARSAGRGGLAADALHMLALVEESVPGQVAANRRALQFAQDSTDPEARGWLATLHHNLGYTLHLAGNYDEALDHFERSKREHTTAGRTGQARIADWMTAWTYRIMGRTDAALEVQLRLEEENDRDNTPDPYVFEELALLYTARGDAERAAH